MNRSMLKNWCEFLSPADIQAIHNTSMKLLAEIGIHFPDNEALAIFNHHGIKIDGQTVYLTEDQVVSALSTVPSQFTVHARNPERDVIIGNGIPVFTPGLGAPFLVDSESGKRSATIEDYRNAVRLAQSLSNQDMNGYQMVMPGDLRSKNAHLAMLHAGIVHSDKAFVGCSDGTVGSNHTIDMAKIIFGDDLTRPVTIGPINPLSPLEYSPDMIEAIRIFAGAGQPLLISTLVMAGSTGPISLAGVLAQQNAEILAGIVLAQLINPGTPVIFGSTSTNVDMRTGRLVIGSPELSLCVSAHTQMARFYEVPCRGGGSLTDSSTTDAQAGFESMFSLLTTINSGTDFVLHSAGIISSYMAFSFDKFILDDEMIGMLRRYMKGIEVTPETLGYEVISKVGHNGHFLGEKHTLERCRTEFWEPTLLDRDGVEAWMSNGQQDATVRARKRWKTLLFEYEEPPLDSLISRQLTAYVEQNT